jgi:hypothetical protein
MKLDTDPFPVDMIEIEHKKILVRTDQAEMTMGKNMDVLDDLCNRMVKPHNPEIGVWKENVQRKPAKRVKPTLAMLTIIPRSEIAETKPPYVCPGYFIHTYSNNMINRCHV